MAINKRLIKSNEGGVPTGFNTVLYTGTGTTNPITGVGFQPDFTWIKSRSGTIGDFSHALMDSVRGESKSLSSNLTNAEVTAVTGLVSFDNNGFTVGSAAGGWNYSGSNYVAWNFKAGGSAVTNTDGTITSQVSANTEAGFSIVSYTGTGANATIGHGLGTAPSMIIVKNRDNAAQLWSVYHASTGAGQVAHLNTTADFSASGDWQSTTPDSNVYYTNNSPRTNELNKKIIAYCFAEVAGFSKFGSYSGGASAIDLGFAPSFIMIKRSDSASDWYMLDITRDGDNNLNTFLYANLSNAENTSGTTGVTVSGNTILPYGSLTTGGGTFIYMAFANQF